MNEDTIVAQATPPGRGGVAIVRLSGSHSKIIAEKICHKELIPRYATFARFKDNAQQLIDEGIGLFFAKPHSFTGEDVVEFQCHGGPVIVNTLIKQCCAYGARLAKPGEFSQRAFLNGKMDLAQAEAIADLIDSTTQQAARSALRSLQGDFSRLIHHLVEQLIQLRMFIEAAIDFPDDDVEFIHDYRILEKLQMIIQQLDNVLNRAKKGVILREGFNVVIAGKPNAGKSSLLNQLSGRQSAIVTDIPGTTRDVMRELIDLDGLPIHLIDTAGLRTTHDKIEQEGIERAKQAIQQADHLLLMIDGTDRTSNKTNKIFNKKIALQQLDTEMQNELCQLLTTSSTPVTLIINKIDQIDEQPKCQSIANETLIYISAKKGLGIDLLIEHLKKQAGLENKDEAVFIARTRQLLAIQEARQHIKQGLAQFELTHAGDLLAEDLRCAQKALGQITGEINNEDLLDKIFSQFCIGK